MTTPSAVRNIPLNKLVLSPTNVRKTPPSAAEEAELKASIKARGLKQNLVVHPRPTRRASTPSPPAVAGSRPCRSSPSKVSFAGTHANGEVAPIPTVREALVATLNS
jgi:hypothetical protein